MLGPLLQYQSLKTVLLHTDANTRFRISTHLPSIRDVEKRIPLKLKYLEMNARGTVINDTSYRTEVVRYHPEGSNHSWPTKVDDQRRQFDFDEFGFQVNVGENVLLPGDISFQLEDEIEDSYAMEEVELSYRDLLKWDEKAVEILSGLKSKRETENYIKTLNRNSKDQLLHRLLIPLEDLRRSIKRKKLVLLSFECRRNKVKSPFKYYLELTVTKDTCQQIKRFEYTKKLFEAVKKLNEVFFGGRSEPILVQLLDLIPCHLTPQTGIYRLPTDCRLHANQVNALDHNLAHTSFPLLIGNSESLDTLWVCCTVEPNALRNQIVRSARRLVIEDAYGEVVMERVIRDLSNREIFIVAGSDHLFFPMHSYALINVWLSGNRPVGASFWIQVQSDEAGRRVLELVESRYANAERTKRCVTIHKDNLTKIKVFYKKLKSSINTF